MLGVDLVLLQDGNYYTRTAGADMLGPGGWESFSHAGFQASDFTNVLYDGTRGDQHPIFSSDGSPIQFGFMGQGRGAFQSIYWDIDNFGVTVVPEPSSAILLGLTLCFYLCYRRAKLRGSRARQ
jgi:hypothetical protein